MGRPPRHRSHAKVPRLVRCVAGPYPGTVDVVAPLESVAAAWAVLVRTTAWPYHKDDVDVSFQPGPRGTRVTVVPATALDAVRWTLVGQCVASSASARGRRRPTVTPRTVGAAADALVHVDPQRGCVAVARTLLQWFHVDRRPSKGLGPPAAYVSTLRTFASLVPLDGPDAAAAWRTYLQDADRHYWNRTAVVAAFHVNRRALAPWLAAARAQPHLRRWTLPWPHGHRAVYATALATVTDGETSADQRAWARTLVLNVSLDTVRRPPRHVRGTVADDDDTDNAADSPLARVVARAVRGSYRPATQGRYGPGRTTGRRTTDQRTVPWTAVWVGRGKGS